MSGKITRSAYEGMIKENLEWLEEQPNTLENVHIKMIVERSADHEYPKHDCGGEHDDITLGVCEGMYADKCDDVIALHAALSEVYALAGDVNGVKEAVETAIANHVPGH